MTKPSGSTAFSPVAKSDSDDRASKIGSNSATVLLIAAFISVISVSR